MINEELIKLLCHIYNSGYKSGHHDTVEGVYTDVYYCDYDEHHLDVLIEIIKNTGYSLNNP